MENLPDCGDNSCFFRAYRKPDNTVRTNGGCRCKPHEVKRAFDALYQELNESHIIIKHCWVHSGYANCGRSKMTTEEQEYYDYVTDKDLDDLLDIKKRNQ